MDKGYSISMRCSHHRKRFHIDEVDNDNNSDSVTSPDAGLVAPTITFTVVQTTVTSTIASAEASPLVAYSQSQTPVSSETPENGAMTKEGDATPTTSTVPSSPSPSGSSVGAIVGTVLAVVLFLAASGIFWFRRRSIASRLKKRQWKKQQHEAPSFLFIESKKSCKVSPFHITLQPHRGKDITAPVKITQPAHDGLPYTPYPAPHCPPPVESMYDKILATLVTTSPSEVSTDLSPPTSPSLTASPSLPKQAETAKVRASFIPTLPDELTINFGEMVRIHMKYDDGWGLCSNARSEMGMLPLECLDRAFKIPWEKSVNKEYRRSVRASSLAATPRSSYGGNKYSYATVWRK